MIPVASFQTKEGASKLFGYSEIEHAAAHNLFGRFAQSESG